MKYTNTWAVAQQPYGHKNMRLLASSLHIGWTWIQTMKLPLRNVSHAWNNSRHNHKRRCCHLRPYTNCGTLLVLIFFVKNKMLLCTVGYYCRFPIVKRYTIWQLMNWWKQPRSYSQNLDSLRNLFQMQAQTLCQICSNSFAGKWT